MNITDILIAGIVLLIVLLAALYIVKAKKKGVRCIGCVDAGKCGGSCSGNCSGNCLTKQ